MNNYKISGSVSTIISNSNKIHDLTMLYLQKQDISKLSIEDLAKLYKDTTIELNNVLNEYRKSLKEN